MPSGKSDKHPWYEVLGPDAELPEAAPNCAGAAAGDSTVSPPKALMLAVLKDAIHCFQQDLGYARARARTLARQAERWIRASDWSSPFSFDSICDSLGIDPDCMRKALLRTKYDRLVGEQQAEQPADRQMRPRLRSRA